MEGVHNKRHHGVGTDHADGHVHFKTEEVVAHDSKIQVEQPEDGIREVHLGFLQIFHVYEITFTIKDQLGPSVTFDPFESLLVKTLKVTPLEDGNGHEVVVEFNAHKEKLMTEKITLRSQDNSDNVLFIIFHARVLGKHKGTPSLRDGVHCLRIEPDEDEGSDWKGF